MSWLIYDPPLALAAEPSNEVIQLLLIHCLLLPPLCVGFYVGSLFCGEVIGFISILAIILLRKRDLVALL